MNKQNNQIRWFRVKVKGYTVFNTTIMVDAYARFEELIYIGQPDVSIVSEVK